MAKAVLTTLMRSCAAVRAFTIARCHQPTDTRTLINGGTPALASYGKQAPPRLLNVVPHAGSA